MNTVKAVLSVTLVVSGGALVVIASYLLNQMPPVLSVSDVTMVFLNTSCLLLVGLLGVGAGVLLPNVEG